MDRVGKKTEAAQMSLRFFAVQIATSSVSNIVGTFLGHPLDTIRVSSIIPVMGIEDFQARFLNIRSRLLKDQAVRSEH